jgi:hypothetical protein
MTSTVKSLSATGSSIHLIGTTFTNTTTLPKRFNPYKSLDWLPLSLWYFLLACIHGIFAPKFRKQRHFTILPRVKLPWMRAEFREYNQELLLADHKAMQITMLTMMVVRVAMVLMPKVSKIVRLRCRKLLNCMFLSRAVISQ